MVINAKRVGMCRHTFYYNSDSHPVHPDPVLMLPFSTRNEWQATKTEATTRGQNPHGKQREKKKRKKTNINNNK